MFKIKYLSRNWYFHLNGLHIRVSLIFVILQFFYKYNKSSNIMMRNKNYAT